MSKKVVGAWLVVFGDDSETLELLGRFEDLEFEVFAKLPWTVGLVDVLFIVICVRRR